MVVIITLKQLIDVNICWLVDHDFVNGNQVNFTVRPSVKGLVYLERLAPWCCRVRFFLSISETGPLIPKQICF